MSKRYDINRSDRDKFVEIIDRETTGISTWAPPRVVARVRLEYADDICARLNELDEQRKKKEEEEKKAARAKALVQEMNNFFKQQLDVVEVFDMTWLVHPRSQVQPSVHLNGLFRTRDGKTWKLDLVSQ